MVIELQTRETFKRCCIELHQLNFSRYFFICQGYNRQQWLPGSIFDAAQHNTNFVGTVVEQRAEHILRQAHMWL